MSMIDKIKNAFGLTRLKYRAIDDTDTTARPVFASPKSEDKVLRTADRAKLIEAARDLERNFSLAGFCIRKYLQSVGYYTFYADTEYPEFNDRLNTLISRWKDNCDVTGRRNFDELIYLAEHIRLTDGDVGILRTSDNRLQLIEGDRIKDPQTPKIDEKWVNGVRLDTYGAPLEYAIWDRTDGGNLVYQTNISAECFDLLGYYTRADQTRGVTPLASALRMFAMLEDSLNLALNKSKIENSLGLVTTLLGDSALAPQPQTLEEREKGIDNAARETFGKGILHLSLKEGESASLLSSNNPSSNFLAFAEQIIRLVFASLDIPYSFYNGSASTFFSQRGEMEQWIDSVEIKQAPTIRLLNRWVRDWLLPNWILAGAIEMPPGVTIDDLAGSFGWTGAGLPVWRLLEYGKDCATAIQLGLVSPKEIVESYGFNPTKNLQDTANFIAAAKELGIELPFGQLAATNIGL